MTRQRFRAKNLVRLAASGERSSYHRTSPLPAC